jgi:hypothetical protein
LKDVKKCFGQLSDAVILQWYRRGLVAGAMIPRGSRSQFAFSFAEIVHIGVTAEMAQYGLTTNAEDLIISMDITHELDDHLCLEYHPFTDPANRLIAFYQLYAYDCCLFFDTDTFEISPHAKRNRVLGNRRTGKLMSPLQAACEVVKWASDVGLQGAKTRFKDKDGSFTLTLNEGSALALIYIPRLAKKAAAALKLPDPWQRQPSAYDQTMRQEIIERLDKL